VTTPSPHRYQVAANPHWHDGSSLIGLQIAWIGALLPAVIAGVAAGGWPALRVIGLTTGAVVVLDAVAHRIFRGKDHPENLSAVVLGLLLGMLLPTSAPWWLAVVGAVLLVLVGKKLFGGWGGWPVHPVALAMAMLLLSWPGRLDYTAASLVAEPVRLVQTLGAEGAARLDLGALFLGDQAAGAANGQVIWLLLGGLGLVVLRAVPWRVPLAFLVGAAATAWLLGLAGIQTVAPPLLTLVSGSTMLMAFFLVTDHTTCPTNPRPQVVYGLLGGALLVMIRAFGSHHDGAIWALLLLNLTSPLLDRWTPRPLGLQKEDAHA